MGGVVVSWWGGERQIWVPPPHHPAPPPPRLAMRHRNAGRTLGRNASHRLALFRNLTRALFEHGRIITTVAKAKEVRPWVEHLITLAKRGLTDPAKSLHARRLCLERLHDKDTIKKLFSDVPP